MRRHDDNRQSVVFKIEVLHHFDAIHAGHADIRHQNVRLLLSERLEQRIGAVETACRNAVALQRFLKHPTYRRVVVDDPDNRLSVGIQLDCSEGSSGKRTMNRVRPGSDSNSITPP